MRRSAIRAEFFELIPWLALVAVWAVLRFHQHGGLYAASDDSYIYLGYVKRALTQPHELFSYNPGEHSAGITGLLYYYVLLVSCALVRAVAPTPSIEAALLLGMSLANAALLLLSAHVYLRCWRKLIGGGERCGALPLAVAFLLFCAQPKWLWAVFSGMEGPLAACLALLLVERLLERAPAWQPSLAAALLVATRPEAILVAWTFPALAVFVRDRRSPARRLLGAYAVAVVGLAALVLPCYVLTGRVFPSSLGTRVEILGFIDPAALARYFRVLLETPAYWGSEWWVLAVLILGAGVVSGLREGRWAIVWLFGFVVAFLALRVVAGIAAFNVEDRYVSYLWPLYALGLGASIAAVVRGMGARLKLEPGRFASTLGAAALYAVAAALPVRDFLGRVNRHVGAMLAIVVEPSRWMATHLPADARICMEPAGAIRLYTDFYLVDAMGLTTTHAATNAGNYADFLHDHRVGWVFDHSYRAGEALLAPGAVRDRRSWARQFTGWGDVHLFEVDLSSAVALVAISGRPEVSGRSRAVFDNNRLARWDPLLGGGSGFAIDRPPEVVTAEFAEPAVVDAVTLAVSAPSGRMPSEYLVELRSRGTWVSAPVESVRRAAAGPARELWTLTLAQPSLVDGVRIVRPREGRASVIDELTLLHGGRPYVWLWNL
jgi:hypothetical protein